MLKQMFKQVHNAWRKRLTAIKKLHKADPNNSNMRHPAHRNFVNAAREFEKIATKAGGGELTWTIRGNGYDCQLASGELLKWNKIRVKEPSRYPQNINSNIWYYENKRNLSFYVHATRINKSIIEFKISISRLIKSLKRLGVLKDD